MVNEPSDPKGQITNPQNPSQKGKAIDDSRSPIKKNLLENILQSVTGFILGEPPNDQIEKNSSTPLLPSRDKSTSSMEPQKTDNPSSSPAQHPPKLLPQIPTNKILSKSVFTVEILVTAGPRKSISDYDNPAQRELGEDAAGACYLENNLIFWLADGTSDQSSLYDLSVRGLAQSLGNAFVIYSQDWLYHKNPNEPFDITHVFKAVEKQWMKRLRHLIKGADEETRKRIWDIFQERSDNTRMLEWSTTFLGGIISYANNEDSLLIVNYGDTIGLCIDRNKDIRKIDRNSSKIAIKAIWSDLNQEPVIEILVKVRNPIEVRPVNNVIAMTDGNSKQSPDALLNDLTTKASQGDVFNDPVALVKKMREYSMDDRAVVICQKVKPLT